MSTTLRQRGFKPFQAPSGSFQGLSLQSTKLKRTKITVLVFQASEYLGLETSVIAFFFFFNIT